MSAPHWSTYLAKAGACDEAVAWTAQFKTPGAAWRALAKMDDTDKAMDWLAFALSALFIVDGCACPWCVKQSLAETMAEYPVPNLDDVKAIARGKHPWELTKHGRETLEARS